MRKENPAILDGLFEMHLPEHPQIVMYQRSCARQTLLVVANFGDAAVDLEVPAKLKEHGWQRVLTNYATAEPALECGHLLPWQAEVYERIW